MFTTITVKLAAESKDELSVFSGGVESAQEHFNMLRNEGIFGPPEQCEVRYLVEGEVRVKQNPKNNTVPDLPDGADAPEHGQPDERV